MASERRGSTSSFYGFDQQSNTRILVSIGGNITDSYLYKAFGEELLVSGTTVNPLRFVGQVGYWRDIASRLYVRTRHLRTDLGRWMSRDPIGFEGDWNLYRYVGNRPGVFIDPLGKDWRGVDCGNRICPFSPIGYCFECCFQAWCEWGMTSTAACVMAKKGCSEFRIKQCPPSCPPKAPSPPPPPSSGCNDPCDGWNANCDACREALYSDCLDDPDVKYWVCYSCELACYKAFCSPDQGHYAAFKFKECFSQCTKIKIHFPELR